MLHIPLDAQHIATAAPTVKPAVGQRPKQIDGSTLARWVKRASATTRAFVALDLEAGDLVVSGMNAKQARTLARASFGYVNTVRGLSATDLAEVRGGRRSLAAFHLRYRPLSDAALDRLLMSAGLERVLSRLDALTAPAKGNGSGGHV